MLNKIITFCVHKYGVVLFLTLLMSIAGFWSFQNLPIDAVPDITNNQVQVNTTVPGLAPEEIERLVTFPVEISMRGMAGVEQVRSITRFGLSQVTVVFNDDIDIYRGRQMVSERLSGVLRELPANAEAKLGPISSGLGEIYQYVIEYKIPSKDPATRYKQLIELKTLQDWSIKPRLMSVKGVTEINTSGGYEKQYHIQPDLSKLRSYGLRIEDLFNAITVANKNVGGGYIQQSAEQFLVQGSGIFKSPKDIENVTIKLLENFKTLRVSDVAKVTLGKPLRTGSATFSGNEAVIGTVMMLLGENSRDVAHRVNEKVLELAKTLPADVQMVPVYNRSELVDATLGTVEHNLVLGASLVILVLFFLIGNVRAAIITAITIPLALLSTFLIMKPLGLSGNLMSLGALDFGIIVDGTVIIIDNCIRFIHNQTQKFGRKLTREEIQQAVIDACIEVRTAAGFGELIVVIVFIPLFGLVGVEGKMFRPMAMTFSIAVFSALILSFTVAPALAGLILSGNAEDKEPFLMKIVHKFYVPVLNFALHKKKVIIALSIASILGAGLLFRRLGSEFLPQLAEGTFAFHMIRPVNTGLDQSLEMQKKAEEILKTFPEVDQVFSRIGTSEVATDPMGVNVSDTFIILKSRDKWESRNKGEKHLYESLAQEMVLKLNDEVPGQTYLASQPIQMRFNELLEGTRADVSVKVFGPDLQSNMDIAKKIQSVVSKVDGAGDVELDLAGLSPVLKVTPKQDALFRYGIGSNDVLEAVSIALGGEEAGTFYENEKRFPIIVRLPEEQRSDLELINNLPVGTGVTQTTPLSALANVNFTETFGSISREDSNRRSAVLINLRGRDTESFVNEAQQLVADKVQIPAGHYIEWGGNFKNLQQAKARLMILAPLAFAIVLFMVFSAFGSIGETLLIFSCVPLALVGGVIGLIARGLPFSISAGVGFIALSGIAVLNGVVLVNYFNHLKSEGMTGEKLVIEGCLIRLRPVLMTALVAVFGFIPMMMSTGIGAEIQRPLATVVVGGIIFSTALTLLVLPVLFNIFEKKLHGKVAH
ncbi:MAG: CusA/CzcA family heavy metal efflux RND transporter [Bacteriovoracaceae bacterium]|nr:CusA/CzcA family heavy metal efflux RND transporter [Bacteriovoracaceae bacterium]